MLRKAALFAFASVALFACDNNQELPAPQAENSNASKYALRVDNCEKQTKDLAKVLSGPNKKQAWVITSYNLALPGGGDYPIDFLNQECILDNVLHFYSDGSFYEEQVTKCLPTDPDPADIGVWDLKDCGDIIHLNTFMFPNTDFIVEKVTKDQIVAVANVGFLVPGEVTPVRVYMEPYSEKDKGKLKNENSFSAILSE